MNVLDNSDVAFDLVRKYGAEFVQIDSVCGHALPQHDGALAEYLERLRGERDVFLLGGVRFKYMEPLQATTSRNTESQNILWTRNKYRKLFSRPDCEMVYNSHKLVWRKENRNHVF